MLRRVFLLLVALALVVLYGCDRAPTAPGSNVIPLNPAFASLTADDFQVIQLGWGQTTTGIP